MQRYTRCSTKWWRDDWWQGMQVQHVILWYLLNMFAVRLGPPFACARAEIRRREIAYLQVSTFPTAVT